jgi:hypothetical protein
VVSLFSSELEELLRVLKKVVFLSLNFFLDLSEEVLRLFVFSLTELVGRFKVFLGRFFFSKSFFGGVVLLFSGIKSLHLLFKGHVD